MSRKLKVKIAALVLVAAASMAVMGVLLSTMQTDLSLDGYTQEMRQEGAALPDVLAEADEDVRQNTDVSLCGGLEPSGRQGRSGLCP